ncbi:hypothetical protein BH11ACT3_BH11ACT3_00240 [soil metagenome]
MSEPVAEFSSPHSEAASPAKKLPTGTPTSLLNTIAIVLSSLVVALPITVGRIVEGILDSTNPAKLDDTSAGLAYLSQILGWSFGVLGVLLLVIIVVYVLIYRRARTLDALKLPLLILAIQIVLGVIAIIFSGFANGN